MAAERMREIRILVPEELFTWFIPTQAHEHLLRAKKEVLLAVRALIDARLEALEKRAAPKSPPKRKIIVE